MRRPYAGNDIEATENPDTAAGAGARHADPSRAARGDARASTRWSLRSPKARKSCAASKHATACRWRISKPMYWRIKIRFRFTKTTTIGSISKACWKKSNNCSLNCKRWVWHDFRRIATASRSDCHSRATLKAHRKPQSLSWPTRGVRATIGCTQVPGVAHIPGATFDAPIGVAARILVVPAPHGQAPFPDVPDHVQNAIRALACGVTSQRSIGRPTCDAKLPSSSFN